MIGALARKFFGSANDRRVKGYQSRVNDINALEPELAALSDEALKARTAEFRQQLADGKTLDDILVPAFATVREARSEEHTSELQSPMYLVCRLLLEKKKTKELQPH